MKMGSKIFFILCMLLTALVTSCEDMVEVSQPRSQLIRATVFEDDITAVAAISALYSRVAFDGFSNLAYPASLSADELIVESDNNQVQFYRNEVLSINSTIELIWRGSYTTIYNANSILEGLENSNRITAPLKKQLIGEAKFFRAFNHFCLVNFFNDVPCITTTNYKANGLVSRMPVSQVYEKIIADLLEAKALLSEDYSYSQNERVRVNKWSAASLLARVYLYREDWIHAEEQATTVINKNSLYSLSADLNKVFLKNNTEAIWQLIPPYPLGYTMEGAMFNRSYYSIDNTRISDELLNAFETNDKRKIKWIGVGSSLGHTWCYPLKYKETYSDTTGADEYSTVFRLAEQYLIRAEARAKQSKLVGANSAESDLNIIRNRAGLPNSTATTQQELLIAIEQERRVEFFAEWGHRWLDLKRTGRATAVLSSVKVNWDDWDVLYPIPYSELQLNPNMTQNLGY